MGRPPIARRFGNARGIKPALSINGISCNAYPRVAAAARDAGWKFTGHGFRQVPTHQILDQRGMVRETVETEGCKVMGLAVHPYITGVPHRIGVLEATRDAIASRPGAVFAQGREILDWWEAQ